MKSMIYATKQEISNLTDDYMKYKKLHITPKNKKLDGLEEFADQLEKIIKTDDFCKFALFHHRIGVGYDSETEKYHFWKLDQDDYDLAVSAIAGTLD
jgi:hypothetical protein